jgi:hypothetical protein
LEAVEQASGEHTDCHTLAPSAVVHIAKTLAELRLGAIDARSSAILAATRAAVLPRAEFAQQGLQAVLLVVRRTVRSLALARSLYRTILQPEPETLAQVKRCERSALAKAVQTTSAQRSAALTA